MRIGINAQLLSYSQNYRNGGVSRYIRFLLTELARQPGEHEYTIFVNGQDVVEHLDAYHPRITYVPVSWSEERPAARVAWEQFVLPSIIRQKHIDVFHSPVNVLPEFLPRTCAGVITLHDLVFLRYPHVLTRSKSLYHRMFTVRSMRQATKIICVSESTRRDAIELVGIAPERLQTVYPCIHRRFSENIDQGAVDSLRQKYGLERGFLLYLGTLEPRKNITTLIDAYAQLRETHQRTEKLVLAGGKGWLYNEIFDRVRQLGLESEIIFPGYVADEEIALWYHAATAFVYPSLYEGYGTPVTEALACGTPVVTSNVSSLPEAGAGLALCVEPHNIQEMAEALYQALTDQDYRQKCRAMASSIAERFSARRMVEQIIAVYEQAAQLQAPKKNFQRTSYVH